MKLNKRQRNKIIEWVAEGLETGEINKRAAKYKPPFKVTRSQVDYYRNTRDIELQKLKAADETSALQTGLALREERVQLLKDLAEKLKIDLFDNDLLWTENAKGLGAGPTWERYDYKEFNAAEVTQLRALLEDIASEVGHRIKRQEITGKDGEPLQPKVDNEGFDRSLNTFADAIREIVSAKDTKTEG